MTADWLDDITDPWQCEALWLRKEMERLQDAQGRLRQSRGVYARVGTDRGVADFSRPHRARAQQARYWDQQRALIERERHRALRQLGHVSTVEPVEKP